MQEEAAMNRYGKQRGYGGGYGPGPAREHYGLGRSGAGMYGGDYGSVPNWEGEYGLDYGYGRGGQRDPRRESAGSYRRGPKGYTRSDERIREDVSERLMSAYDIDSSEVTISVQDGKVTLEGTVPDRRMKHAIEDIADGCAGVQDIDNRVRVSRGSYGSTSTSSR
jgi:hypothetical protein